MKILDLLNARERRLGIIIVAMAVVMALLETVGVASIMPFLAVLGDPSLIRTNTYLKAVYAYTGYNDVDSFVVALGFASFFVVMFSAIFRVIANFVMNQYTEMRRHSIGERLLETYLHHPYEFFIQNNTADLAKSILSEVDQITTNIFRPLIQLISYSVVMACMVGLLIVIDVRIAFAVLLLVGGAYLIIFMCVRRLLERTGRGRVEANRQRYTAASEALGGIKDIKLLGREQAYLERFRGPSLKQSRYQAVNTTVAQLPKFLIEAVGFGGVIALALVLLATNGGVEGKALGQVLPMLGVYAFAGLRLLPAAQNIYSSAANIRFGIGALDEVWNDLRSDGTRSEPSGQSTIPVVFEREIEIDALSYTYPGAQRSALTSISLTIPSGSKVGLVGTTGCGKTTFVDLLLGLLEPTSGAIRVDGVTLSKANMRTWQESLGYVQQDIFLADNTVAANIALGVPLDLIDHDQVMRCARIANLYDFVMSELPDKFETMVGERGVRLSGGQRQRIGIARALYRNPRTLILDEATSALDNRTEQSVMESVYAMGREITAVIIAHRLSTVKHCNTIYFLDAGGVAAHGTYEELIESSAGFRKLAVQNH